MLVDFDGSEVEGSSLSCRWPISSDTHTIGISRAGGGFRLWRIDAAAAGGRWHFYWSFEV